MWWAGSPPDTASGWGCAARRQGRAGAVSSSSTKLANAIATTDPAGEPAGQHAALEPADQNGSETSGPSVTLLPRRNPGTSGITDVPAPPAEQLPRRQRRELATPWWENGQQPNQSPEPRPAPEPRQAAEPRQAPEPRP